MYSCVFIKIRKIKNISQYFRKDANLQIGFRKYGQDTVLQVFLVICGMGIN